jgi:hypothetical protein
MTICVYTLGENTNHGDKYYCKVKIDLILRICEKKKNTFD